ncbi:MAG: RNA polymerase sigma factor [Phycisphaerales bacterium]
MDFADEYMRHHRVLWVVAFGVVANAADADDILQEAAIAGLRRFDSFAPGTNFRAWMAEIVRFCALNYRRSKRRQSSFLDRNTDPASIGVAPSESGPSPVGIGGQLRDSQGHLDDRLTSALERLDPTARACVLLRCIESLGYDEISLILGIPPGTAMSHVFRARRQLSTDLLQARSLEG